MPARFRYHAIVVGWLAFIPVYFWWLGGKPVWLGIPAFLTFGVLSFLPRCSVCRKRVGNYRGLWRAYIPRLRDKCGHDLSAWTRTNP
jgi:hypothetical protein